MSSIVYEKSSDFSQKVSSNPHYIYTKVLQTQGNSNVPLSQGTPYTTQFDIPSKVMNFSRSFLDFQINVNAPTLAANFAAALLDVPPIRRTYLATRGSQYICDINNVQPYWKMCKNTIIPTEKFNSSPPASYGATLAAAQDNGLTLFCNPSNSLPATVPAAFSPHGSKISNTPVAAPLVDNASIFRRAYQSEMPYVTGGAGNANATGQLFLNCRLEFNRFAFSFFNIDRDFFSNEALVLVIEWESYDNFLFQHASGAGGTVADLLNPATLTFAGAGANVVQGPPTITGVGLYLAVQQNESINEGIKAKVLSSGLVMTIPYINVFNQVLTAATSASVSYRINSGMGRRLLRIISSEALTVSTLSSRCNFYNLGAVGTQNFYTTMDSTRIEAENIDETVSLGFTYNLEKLKGTPLGVLQEYYTNCPIHINDWSSCESLIEAPEKDLNICGMELSSQDHVWAKFIGQKAAVDYTTWIVIVTQKDLISTAEGIRVQ